MTTFSMIDTSKRRAVEREIFVFIVFISIEVTTAPSKVQYFNLIKTGPVPSSDAKFKNFSETNSCFFVSRNVVQNEPSLDSERKVINFVMALFNKTAK